MTKKTNFKKHLLASASVLAIGAFAASTADAAALGASGAIATGAVNTVDQDYIDAGTAGAVTSTNNGVMILMSGASDVTLSAATGAGANVYTAEATAATNYVVSMTGTTTATDFALGSATVTGASLVAGHASASAILMTTGDAAGTITNYGTITGGATGGTGAGISFAGTAYATTITNNGMLRALGTGSGLLAATGAFGTITNTGTIRNTEGTGNGIEIGAATITTLNNTAGLIEGASGSGVGSGILTTGAATITTLTNTGTIRSTTGGEAGILLSAGANITTLNNSGTITDATTGVGLHFVNGSSSTVLNSGIISAGGAGSGVYVAAGTLTGNQEYGSIYNTGTISAVGGDANEGAVDINGAIVNNYTSGYVAATGKGAGFYNAKSITETTGVGIQLSAAGATNVTNAATGTIVLSGAGTGVAYNGAASGTFLNLGNISTVGNAGNGILVAASAVTGTINNGGTITSTLDGKGISITGNTVITTLTNSGSITGVTGEAVSHAGTGIITAFTNSGSLTGTASTGIVTRSSTGSFTTFTNSGNITDAGDGIAVLISGAAGAAEAINNTATGTITSKATATTSKGTINVSGESVNTTLTNAGVISNTASTDAGAAIYFAAGGDLTIVNSGTISASASTGTAIDNGTAGNKGVTITNTGVITGGITTNATVASTINLNSVNTISGTTVTGNQLNGNISLKIAADAVNFNQGASAVQGFTGTIVGTTNAIGAVTAQTGTTTLINQATAAGNRAVITANTLAISSGATLYIKGAVPTAALPGILDAVSLGGAATVTGTLQLGARTTLASAGLTANASTSNITIDVTTVSSSLTTGILAGQINSTGTVALAGAATLTNGVSTGTANGPVSINYSNPTVTYQKATSGTSAATATAAADITLFTGATSITWTNGTRADGTAGGALGSTAATGYVLGDNSYVLKFVGYGNAAQGAATKMYVNVTRENAYQTASSVTNTKAVGAALEAVGAASAGNAALQTIQATLDGYSTAAAVESAVKTLDTTTSTSGQTTQSTVAAQNVAIGTVESRLETARNETSGVATGGKMNSSGVWGEVFGATASQDTRKGVDGYDADVVGFALGADTAISNQIRVGAALAYANTDSDGTRNEATSDSYQGSVYGSYDMGKIYYEGLAAFTFSDYDTSRTLFDGSVANAGFNGQQYTAKATAGYKLDGAGSLKVTPFVSAQYTLVTVDDYTEVGSNAPLHVKTDNVNIFKTGLGAKVALPIVEGGVTYTPRATAAWYYDLVGDEVETTSNFASAASTTFISKGADVAQSSYRLGAGLDVMAQDNVTVSLDYNWDAKSDYDSHTGELKARFEF